jgi:pectate lyase
LRSRVVRIPMLVIALTALALAACGGSVDPSTTPTEDTCERVPQERLDLLRERVGFGRSVTGGANRCIVHVSSEADSGPGSLREVAERGEAWVVFERDLTITLQDEIQLGSNLTIDGRGARVEITGAGLYLTGRDRHNVILENLFIRHAPGEGDADLIRISEGATDFWLDHLTLADAGDEYIDVSRTIDGTDGTVSWCRFDPGGPINTTEFAILVGDEASERANELIALTLHHNWYNETSQRHPLVSGARLHSFNNYIAYRLFGIQVRRFVEGGTPGAGAQVVSEHDVFEAASTFSRPEAVFIIDEGNSVRVVSPLLVGALEVQTADSETAFDPSSLYAYRLDLVEAVEELVRAGAGWREVDPASLRPPAAG